MVYTVFPWIIPPLNNSPSWLTPPCRHWHWKNHSILRITPRVAHRVPYRSHFFYLKSLVLQWFELNFVLSDWWKDDIKKENHIFWYWGIKDRSKMKKRTKEEELEEGDDGPPTRKVSTILSNLNQAVPRHLVARTSLKIFFRVRNIVSLLYEPHSVGTLFNFLQNVSRKKRSSESVCHQLRMSSTVSGGEPSLVWLTVWALKLQAMPAAVHKKHWALNLHGIEIKEKGNIFSGSAVQVDVERKKTNTQNVRVQAFLFFFKPECRASFNNASLLATSWLESMLAMFRRRWDQKRQGRRKKRRGSSQMSCEFVFPKHLINSVFVFSFRDI